MNINWDFGGLIACIFLPELKGEEEEKGDAHIPKKRCFLKMLSRVII